MENNKKLSALIKVCWFALFTIWLICIISGKFLNIIIDNVHIQKLDELLQNQVWLDYIIRFLMYYIQTILVFYAIHQKKMFEFKPIIISLAILGCWLIKTIFINIPITNYIDLILMLSFMIFDLRKWKRVIVGLGMTLGITLISSIINNLCIVGVDFSKLNTILVLYFSIDIYIMTILYYLYSRKEVEHNGQLVTIFQSRKKMENHKHCFSNIISTCSRWYRDFISDLRFNYCSIIFFIITYGSILILAYFYNRMIEITIAVVCFHIFRKFDKKTFHASTDVKCWVVSVLSFWIIIGLSLPLYTSILSTIILSYLLTKIMYYIQDYIDYISEKKLAKDLVPLNKLTKQELQEMFSEYSTNDINAIYMCLHKDRSMTYDHIAYKYNMTRMTLYRIMKKVKNKYSTLLKD